MLKKNLKRLTFTDKVEDLKGSQVFFVCVGTPQDEKGKANLNFVFSAVENIKPLLISGKEEGGGGTGALWHQGQGREDVLQRY
jgi:UDP-glucose 6-dehydrogenase